MGREEGGEGMLEAVAMLGMVGRVKEDTEEGEGRTEG